MFDVVGPDMLIEGIPISELLAAAIWSIEPWDKSAFTNAPAAIICGSFRLWGELKSTHVVSLPASSQPQP